jgi:hypothetical protein
MPAHLIMLTILPVLLVISTAGIVALVCLQPSDLFYPSILVLGAILLAVSRYAQTFVKAQISMFIATIGLLFGLETQKFARLASTREPLGDNATGQAQQT